MDEDEIARKAMEGKDVRTEKIVGDTLVKENTNEAQRKKEL